MTAYTETIMGAIEAKIYELKDAGNYAAIEGLRMAQNLVLDADEAAG